MIELSKTNSNEFKNNSVAGTFLIVSKSPPRPVSVKSPFRGKQKVGMQRARVAGSDFLSATHTQHQPRSVGGKLMTPWRKQRPPHALQRIRGSAGDCPKELYGTEGKAQGVFKGELTAPEGFRR